MTAPVLHFRCSFCTSEIEAPQSKIGQKIFCPACYRELVVPEKDSVPLDQVDPSKLYVVDAVPIDVRQAPERYQFYNFECPVCRSSLALRKDDIGKDCECPDCGTITRVPESVLEQKQASPFAEKKSELAKSEELYGLDISHIKGTFLDGKGKRIDPKGLVDQKAHQPRKGEFSVYCPLCETLQYTTGDKVGTKILCPECEREFMVFAPSGPGTKKKDEILTFEGSDVYEVAGDNGELATVSPIGEPSPPRAPRPPKPRDRERDPNLVPVVCKLCGTRMYVSVSKIGTKKKCPDCFTETIVQAPSKEKQQEEERILPSVSENDVYGIAAEEVLPVSHRAPLPERRAQGVPGGGVAPPGTTGFTPLPGNPAHYPNGTKQTPRTLPRQSEQIVVPSSSAVHKVEVPQATEHPIVSSKKKKGVKKGPREVLEGGVTARIVGDNVILVAPRPPRRPMWNRLFLPLASIEVLTRVILAGCVGAVFLSFLTHLFLPLIMAEQNAIDAKGLGAILMVPMAAVTVAAFAVWLRLFGIVFMSLFMSASTGSGPIQEWNEDDFVGGLVQAGWIASLAVFAAVPGILLFSFLRHVPGCILMIPALLIFLALFPFMLLSSLQSGGVPVTSALFVSLFRCGVTWTLFYCWSVLLIGLPVYGWYFCPMGTPFLVGGLLVFSIVNTIYPVMIARLAWVIADDIKYANENEGD